MTCNLGFFNGQSDINLKLLLRRECKEFNDTIIIESSFKETTRDGKDILRYVKIAIAARYIIIANEKDSIRPSCSNNQFCDDNSKELIQFYPWHLIQLYVFKKTRRKCIKALYIDNSTRYFELQEMPKIQIHWYLWRQYILELHNPIKRWPFTNITNINNDIQFWNNNCVRIKVVKHKTKVYTQPQWTDKYLYLGSLREVEDQIRPRPVAGLGKTEDIKLLYLKPRYFGCWEQSEHWVQCGESLPKFIQE